MSENPESATRSAMVSMTDEGQRDRRLRRVLTWVGIVIGVVFIVAVVFFSGFALGRGSGGYHGWNRGYQGQMGPGGGGCPMMGTGTMGRGGMGSDDRGPGMMRPGQPSASPSPAAPPR